MATILIADDDPKQRGDLVRAALQADFPPEGIVEAKTEEEANELVETQAFNVALVDIMLSEPWGKEEGLRVIAKLKALQPDCRVIALTTKLGGTEVGVRALEVGAHDFLSSKWDHVNWLALLRTRLKLWKGVVEGQLPSSTLEV